jgi:transposase-like protein
MAKKRTNYPPQFKAKVALAAVRQEKTLSQLAAQFKVHTTAIAKWKARLLEQAVDVFIDGRTQKKNDNPTTEELYQEIGRLKVELDWVKKKSQELD